MEKLSLILTAAILALVQPIAARETGYKGNFDVKYAYSFSDGHSDFDSSAAKVQFSNQIMFTTTHGYQFNPYIFAGAGLGLSIWYESDNILRVPIYADIKVYPFADNACSPYVDVQLGYTAGDANALHFYFNPEIGIRFGLNERFGLNVGIGYQWQEVESWNPYRNNSLTFKLGFDF